MRSWMLLAVLGTLFAAIGAVMVVLAFVIGEWGLLSGGVFLVVGLGMLAGVPRLRRENRIGDAPMQPVVARQVPADTPRPWSFADLAAAMAHAYEETPYTVEANDERIRVRADLADARFLGLCGVRRVKRTQALDVVRKGDGVAATVDSLLGVDWTAGVARLSGGVTYATGKSFSWSKRVEYGVGPDGRFGKQVDYTFSSRELSGPVSDVLVLAGWKERWPLEARGAVVMAAIGASAVVIVPVAFLVRALIG